MREIDALVAEHLFEWGWITGAGFRWFAPLSDIGKTNRSGTITYQACIPPLEHYAIEDGWWLEEANDYRETVPPYSTDIGAAWQVVEAMRGRYGRTGDIYLNFVALLMGDDRVTCRVFDMVGPDAAKRISTSALRALGVEVPSE